MIREHDDNENKLEYFFFFGEVICIHYSLTE